MKIINKIMIGIAVLCLLLCGGVLAFALNPDMTGSLAQMLYGTENNAEAVTEAVQATEHTEVATEAPAPVVQTPSDARVTQVIAGINAERAAAGLAAVTYDATLTDMAQVRASENAANDYFVIENGKHKRPDGRNASSICSDFGQAGYFGEVMGRYQTSPAEIVTGWHNSATHYACMTSTKYSRVGVGVAADSEGYLYWVAIFMD